MAKKMPKFELVKNPEYKVLYVNNVFGGVDPTEGRMIFSMDRLELKIKEGGLPGEMETDRIVRELLVEIRVSPLEFKAISDWMVNSINRLEKAGYKFPKPTKPEDKTTYVA